MAVDENDGVAVTLLVGVFDGDTITVLDDAKAQHKNRIAGIDAPEKGQAFGERSKQALSALAFQKRVESRCDPGARARMNSTTAV